MFHPQRTASGSISVYGKTVSHEGCPSLINAGFELDDCIFEPLPTRIISVSAITKKLPGPWHIKADPDAVYGAGLSGGI
mgnify:CR=1 FL=1